MTGRGYGGHRDPDSDVQLETCDLCGMLFPRHRLRTVTRVGNPELTVCDTHGAYVDGMDYRDYLARRPSKIPESPQRLPPFGRGPAPWEDA